VDGGWITWQTAPRRSDTGRPRHRFQPANGLKIM
jgi:hypothetical protein